MNIARAVKLAHTLLRDKLAVASVAVDATCGNGHDTLFMARSSPADAVIWAFDVQTSALAATAQRLTACGLADKVRLIEDCHSRLGQYVVGPIDVAMFNLGYRPGGDHATTTLTDTTIAALEQVFGRLAAGGLVSIIAYPGHPAGALENAAVADLLSTLPPKVFSVACWQALNRQSEPPVLYIVEKAGSGEHEGFTSRPD